MTKDCTKRALVAGATGGIGQAVIKQLIDSQYRVVILGRSYDKMNDLIIKYGSKIQAVEIDFANYDVYEEIFKQLMHEEEKFSCFIYLLGVSENLPLRVMDEDNMNKAMKVNYYYFVSLMKYFSKKKVSVDHASVVAMSSMASLCCDKGMSQYAASKSALNSAVKVFAKELILRKIRVNAIAPGFVNTNMLWQDDYSKEREEEFVKQQPLGIIPPERIAELVLFLISDSAEYITGEIIPVSGGMQSEH